jgi:hypothetical protein
VLVLGGLVEEAGLQSKPMLCTPMEHLLGFPPFFPPVG